MNSSISLFEDEYTIQVFYDKYKIIFTKKTSGNFSFQQINIDEKITSNNRLKFFNRYNIGLKNVHNPILQHDKNYIIAQSPIMNDAFKSESQIGEADAVLVLNKDIYGMITFADCIPLALINTKKNACASIHLGSRSIVKNVINSFVSEWQKILDIDNSCWFAIIGPSIFYENYEIKDDYYKLIQEQNEELLRFVYKTDNKMLFDNRAALKFQLSKLSINTYFSLEYNTYNDNRFSSYRKDKPNHITHALLVSFH